MEFDPALLDRWANCSLLTGIVMSGDEEQTLHAGQGSNKGSSIRSAAYLVPVRFMLEPY